MNSDELYRYASGVNIYTNHSDNEENRATGYDGEYELFCALLRTHPEEHMKFLMNLEVPTGIGDSTTEIDCLMICKSGFVVYEAKHYDGTIFGKPHDRTWTQHFRTSGNFKFNNPLKQNQYHIQALKRLFPDIPCYSVVIFTNQSCNLSPVERPSSAQEFCIAKYQLGDALNQILNQSTVLTDEQVESIFETMTPYAPNYSPLPTQQPNIATYGDLVERSQKELSAQISAAKDAKRKAIIGAILFALACIVFAGVCIFGTYKVAQHKIGQYEKKYSDMLDNFQPMHNSDFDLDLGIFDSEYRFKSSPAFDATEFRAQLSVDPSMAGSSIEYGNAELIVQQKDGSVKSYDVKECSESLRYVTIHSGTTRPLLGPFLLSETEDNVAYIKIKGLVFYADAMAQLRREGHTVQLKLYEAEN